MKTQINHLINGSRNIIHFDESKYKNITKGTSLIERYEVGKKVKEENGDILRANIQGVEVEFHSNYSTTGKTWWYKAWLSKDEIRRIVPYYNLGNPNKENEFNITINMDMTITLQRCTRSSEKAQWRSKDFVFLGEECVEIL